MKVIFNLEMIQFLICKLAEFDEISTSLLHSYNVIQPRLTKINDSNRKRNRYFLLNDKDEIQEYKKELDANEEKLEMLQQLVQLISEKCGSDNIKNYAVSKCNVLEQSSLSLQSLVSSAEEAAENSIKLWNKYHEDLHLCHQYLIELESVMYLYDGSVLNLTHLHQNTSRLKLIIQEFTNNEKLLDNLLLSSRSVIECSDAGIQLEIESDIEMLQNKWNFRKNSLLQMIENQESLEKHWNTYIKSCSSLSDWVTNVENLLLCLQLNNLYSLMEYKNTLEKLPDKKKSLLSLKETADKICSYSCMHSSAKKSIVSTWNSLASSLNLLGTASLFCKEIVSDVCQDKEYKERRIQMIMSSLDNRDMGSFDGMPSNKQELGASLLATEETLQVISQHTADLLCMRENLILQEIVDFALVNSINVSLLRIQEVTSKLSSHYLKLVETCAKENSFLENCICLLQLLAKLKSLHMMSLPTDYKSLVALFLRFQVMEIYIHSHQIIMLQIVNSGVITSSFRNEYGAHNLLDCLAEFIKEWNSFETAYRKRMTIMKQHILLWQKYLHLIYKLGSSLKQIRKAIVEETLAADSHGQNDTSSWIIQLENQLHGHKEEITIIRNSAEELIKALRDPQMEEQIQKQLAELKNKICSLLGELSDRRNEIDKINDTCTSLMSDLKSSNEKLSLVQQYVTQDIPPSFKEKKKELERAKVQKERNKEVMELLSNLNVSCLRNEQTDIRYPFEEQITTQKNLCNMLRYGLDQHTSVIHLNLETLSAFDRKCLYLLKLCEKIEKKIKQKFLVSPENALNNLKNIEKEKNHLKANIDDTVVLGNALSCNEELSQNIAEKMSTLNSAFSQVAHLHDQRLQILQRVTKCIEDLSVSSEKLSHFLTTAENSIEIPVDLKDMSYEEIEKQLISLQALRDEVAGHEEDASTIQKLVNELNTFTDNFNVTFKQNALQYPVSVLHRWTSFKTFIIKRSSSLISRKHIWDEFFISLKKLEEWLTSKENIAYRVNYSDPGHSRATYLEGVGVFENLNHCFQDDIHLLHSLNSSYHNISRKEFNVSSSLKDRVLSANDRWHKLYKKVTEVFDTIKNILQKWEDFEQMKEHLLLFLTEIDMELTNMETTHSFEESTCQSIKENFELHKDARERYHAMAKLLMKQSECSIPALQSSVDEVENYWDELCKRLSILKKTESQHVEEKDIEVVSEPLLQSEIAYYDHFKHGEIFGERNISTSDEFGQIYHSEITQSKFDMYSEPDAKVQFVSHVVSSAKEPSIETEAMHTIIKTLDNSEVKKSPSVKQTVASAVRTKQSAFDEDCLKDLLAALKEAEERMDVLERVLAELTPTGIDEQAPNYSHLLAACRSSVDVIQHLSQFLFYDVPLESDVDEKAEIRLQSEDLLQRWQRIENLTLDKEFRALENKKKWETFSKDLKGFETWIQKALQDYSDEAYSEADMEKLVDLIEKHRELILQIRAQKKIILMLNLTGHKLLSASTDTVKTASLNQRIKNVNDHWDSLYATALKWQSKLQSEFLQSTEFKSTIDEMRLWLEESEKRLDEMLLEKERNDTVLHAQHTELYALKQQLEVYCNRLETLLEITTHLFLPEISCDDDTSLSEESLMEVEARLKSNLKMSQALLIKCTEMLKNVSSLLGFSKIREQISYSRNDAASISGADGQPSNRSECCSFLMRVARASFPIQAILLLLLGAAILYPMEEEEELSCRLSNNFATSLNTMLRYPDGPPPV